MKNILSATFILSIAVFFISCSVETETQLIKTPTLELRAIGPMFEGSNTATVTWEYNLEELIKEYNNETQVEEIKVSSIRIKPIEEFVYPEIGEIVMELKPGNQAMSRVGLLEEGFNKAKPNLLTVASIQEDFKDGFKEERLTFVADFDLKDEEYYDDITFELVVAFELKTRK